MVVDISEDGTIVLGEVFNPIALITEEGEELVVCMRDGAFEIGIRDLSIKSDQKYFKWYSASHAAVTPLLTRAVSNGS